MPKFTTVGDDPLSAVVNVRVTQAERARLADDAELAGLSLSALVRSRYFGRPLLAKADVAMLKELRRQGGLLKLIHTESAGAYRQQTSDALAAHARLIAQIESGGAP